MIQYNWVCIKFLFTFSVKKTYVLLWFIFW